MPRKQRQEQSDDLDIRGWFKTLGPPPTGQAPPHLRASVLAQIEQRRARRGLWAWLPQGWPAAWAPALAAGLVLSVALNVWWGMARRDAGQPLAARPAPVYQFQTGIQNAKALGTGVSTRVATGDQRAGLGFGPQDTRITFFRLGLIYADALATLRRDAFDAAAQRLDILARGLDSVQAPHVLSQYLSTLQTLLRSQRYTGEELAKFLALFEPLYEAEYATGKDGVEVTLFRLGAWLENMAIAAAASDQMSLRQEPAVVYFRQALTQLGAPPEVLTAFEQMRRLVTTQTMTDRAVRTLFALVQDVQKVLGAVPD
jgi:hypothetical protein